MSRGGIIVHLVDDRMFFKVLGSGWIASLSERGDADIIFKIKRFRHNFRPRLRLSWRERVCTCYLSTATSTDQVSSQYRLLHHAVVQECCQFDRLSLASH